MTGTLPRRAAPTRDLTGLPTRWTEAHLARLAAHAAGQTPGVYAAAAVAARTDGRVARVDLDLVVDYGQHVPTVAEAVRRRVAARFEAYAGVTVQGVTVTVVDVRLPGEEAD